VERAQTGITACTEGKDSPLSRRDTVKELRTSNDTFDDVEELHRRLDEEGYIWRSFSALLY